MAKIKGVGAIVLTDWRTPSTFEPIGCVFGLNPPGIEFDTTQDEQCLDEVGVASVDLGDEQPDEVVITAAFHPHSALDDAMWARALGRGQHTYRLKYPNEADYQEFGAQIRVYKPDEVTREEFMKVPITLLRRTPVTWVVGAVKIRYPDPSVSFPNGVAISNITPTEFVNAVSAVASPTLPDGLSLASGTGVISGTPTSPQLKATYAITATAAGGETDTAYIEIEVT